MATGRGTAPPASKATDDALREVNEVSVETKPPCVNHTSERRDVEDDQAVKNQAKVGSRRRRRRTPSLSERPKTLAAEIREIRANVVEPALQKVEHYRNMICDDTEIERSEDTLTRAIHKSR